MSEIKLLPCPFCGGEAKACKYYFIQCTKCGTSTLTHTNREEAIKTLQEYDNVAGLLMTLPHEVCEMAIADMEKQIECDRDCKNCWKTKLVNEPKVGEWIPCSERLPDNNENVLVWCEGYFQPWIGWYGDIKRSWFVIDYDGECEKYKVIAWMPLPPAYKGE